jgi:hypothetical protein
VRDGQADLLASLLSALGEAGGPLLAAKVAAEPPTEGVAAPHAGLLLGLADAAANGRVGETVLLAVLALAEAGPAADPFALGTAVQALHRIGLNIEARRLALEGALAHGL